jgi:hypothetical protein
VALLVMVHLRAEALAQLCAVGSSNAGGKPRSKILKLLSLLNPVSLKIAQYARQKLAQRVDQSAQRLSAMR